MLYILHSSFVIEKKIKIVIDSFDFFELQNFKVIYLSWSVSWQFFRPLYKWVSNINLYTDLSRCSL